MEIFSQNMCVPNQTTKWHWSICMKKTELPLLAKQNAPKSFELFCVSLIALPTLTVQQWIAKTTAETWGFACAFLHLWKAQPITTFPIRKCEISDQAHYSHSSCSCSWDCQEWLGWQTHRSANWQTKWWPPNHHFTNKSIIAVNHTTTTQNDWEEFRWAVIRILSILDTLASDLSPTWLIFRWFSHWWWWMNCVGSCWKGNG